MRRPGTGAENVKNRAERGKNDEFAPAMRLFPPTAAIAEMPPDKHRPDRAPEGRDVDLALILKLLDATIDLAQRIVIEAVKHSICRSKDCSFSVFQADAPVMALSPRQSLG